MVTLFMSLFTIQQRYKYYFSCCIFQYMCVFFLVRIYPSALFSLCAFFRVRFFPSALFSHALIYICVFFRCAFFLCAFFQCAFFRSPKMTMPFTLPPPSSRSLHNLSFNSLTMANQPLGLSSLSTTFLKPSKLSPEQS